MRLALFLLAALAASGCAAIPAVTDAPVSPNSSSEPVSVPGVPAQNAEASAVLNGAVTARVRVDLPPGAVVTVRLEDVSRADAPAQVVAEQTIRQAAGVPVPFALAYTPSAIDVRHRYGVRAEIRDAAGALLFATTTVTPVFTNGAPLDGVEAVVEPVSR